LEKTSQGGASQLLLLANIIRMIMSRRIRWADVARMRENFGGKAKRKEVTGKT
jgi:hypothetical protein